MKRRQFVAGSLLATAGLACKSAESGNAALGLADASSTSDSAMAGADSGLATDSAATKDSATPVADAANTDAAQGVILGSGAHTYEWVPDWLKLPAGVKLGYTHGGVIVDSKQRVYINSDDGSAPVFVFDTDGNLLSQWNNQFTGGLHAMLLFQEMGQERLFIAHHKRFEVVKTTLQGDVLMTLPFPDKAGIYKTQSEYQPTGIAIGPNGHIYVSDGYGQSWIHEYDSKGAYTNNSWGGLGTAPGLFNNPHGIWLDTRKNPAVLIVCDRGNHRLQTFDLDGKLLGVNTGIVSLPCQIDQRGDELMVADLDGRITLLDKDNKLIMHLGQNPDPALRGELASMVPPAKWKDGLFNTPHCARWDAAGNLYVLDWTHFGRVTKLKRVS